MPITPSLRHCSNKYKLAREGEKDEDFEKVKDNFFFFLLSSQVELKEMCVNVLEAVLGVVTVIVSVLHERR